MATGEVSLVLNTRRGLAVESLAFGSPLGRPVVGTLSHGHYDDISLGADFYTGHLVLEPPGAPKVTDLERMEPEVHVTAGAVEVSGVVVTPLGRVRKTIRLVDGEPVVGISYELDWSRLPAASCRLGHVTLLPDAFDRSSLYYSSHNGGSTPDRFALPGSTVDHGRPVSSLVSATGGLGVTGGVVEIGDARHAIRVEVDKSCSALIGLMTYREVRDTFFCRLAFSALELDETSRPGEPAVRPILARIAIRGVVPGVAGSQRARAERSRAIPARTRSATPAQGVLACRSGYHRPMSVSGIPHRGRRRRLCRDRHGRRSGRRGTSGRAGRAGPRSSGRPGRRSDPLP